MTKLTIDLDNYGPDEKEAIQSVLNLCATHQDVQVEDPIWRPNKEHFYYVHYNGLVDSCMKDKCLVTQRLMWNAGNIFKTYELADRMSDRRKRIGIFENKMMEFADGYEWHPREWGSNSFILYNRNEDKWVCSDSHIYTDPLCILMTKENATKAVEWANKHYPEGL